MTKQELDNKTDLLIVDTTAALQAIYDALNKGQQQKLIKNPAIKALLERYEVKI